MKKQILTMAAALLASASSFGQFFTSTSYRGAFGVGSGANWLTGWTEFNPNNAVYPGNGAGESLAGKTRVNIGNDGTDGGAPTPGADGYFHITSNTTWSSSNVYYLFAPIAVDNGVTLTIQAGTVIRGTNQTIPTCLVISRGAQLNAAGTSANPIVFTSSQPAGSRNAGDWGGLILCGRAQVNLNKSPNLGGRNVEGTVTTAPGTASYYGSGNGSTTVNDAESSGTLQYVRCEFAGDATVANQELNGIMLAAIGSGTTFDHIQVSYSKDDSFEWFGGTVDGKYLVAFGGTDDDFDVDEGYRGRNQFGLIVRDPRFCDYGSSAGSSNFFEMDNNTTSSGNATSDQTQYSPQPTTSCVFSNVTCIGPLRNGEAITAVSDRFGGGWNARTNPGTAVFNSIFVNPRNSVVISNTPAITGASTVLNPSNWTKLSCDSLILRNSAMLMDVANTTARVTVGGQAGAAADCQSVFATKDAATLESFLENATNANTVDNAASLTPANLGMASPWFTGTLTTSPPTVGNFTNGPLSWSSFDPTLTSGSPYASGASFSHPRLGSAGLPSLTISSAQTGVFGQYSNVTVTGTGSGTLTVQNGATLTLGSNSILGTGAVSIAAGANVSTAAAGGFANAGNGVTRNSGAKTLSADANYTFNGTTAQNTGGFWTGGRDVTINNAAGVTLSSAATVGGKLSLQAGAFNAGNNLLTINSTSTRQGIIDNFSSGFTGTLGTTSSINFKVFAGTKTLTSVAPAVISNANTINSVIVPNGLSCANVKEFDEFSNNWIPVDVAGGACTDPMVNSPAVLSSNSLLASGSGTKNYTYTGLPQTSAVNRTISRSAGTVPPAPFVARGWNALSNPFAAPINWASFDTPGNLAQSPCVAYIWNSSTNNYGTISPAGVTTGGANVNIAPGQGILIRRSSVGSGSVTFDPSLRVSSTTRTYIREAQPAQEIRIQLNGMESSDEVMIASGEEIVNVDKYFSPSEESVSLFIPNGEEGLTTLKANFNEQIIPLSVKTAEGTFNLTFTSLNGISEGYKVVLEDRLNNQFREVKQGDVYSFFAQGGNAARFALHIQQDASVNNQVSALIYSAGNQVEIRTENGNESTMVQVRDLSGRLVDSYEFSGNNSSRVLRVADGVYTVSIRNSQNTSTRKVLINNK
jgi:hypothetical protein